MSRQHVAPATEATDEQAPQPSPPASAAPLLPREVPDWQPRAIVRAFQCAFAGVWYLFSTQRNAQIHLILGGLAIGLGWMLQIARWEWAVLVAMIALVIALEGMNTAIEAAVDVATQEYHPIARVAKDVAAGAVLIAAIAALVLGCIIFLPHLWVVLQQVLGGSAFKN